MTAPALDFRAALRLVAEALPAGAAVPVPREELLQLLGKESVPALAQIQPEDRLLTSDEASGRLGMSKEWLYNNAHRLPFTVRIGRRALRFSSRGIEKYLERQRRR